MAAVLYLLGLVSIVLGAGIGADKFFGFLKLGLSLSVAYQAIVGGILLFVMARLLQHAAATARNTEKFYQQALLNSGAAAAAPAAPAVATPEVKAAPAVEAPKAQPAPEAPKPEAPKAEAPKAEAPKAEEKPAEKPAEKAPAEEAKAPEAEKPAEAPAPKPAPEPAAAPAEPTVVEQIEYRGYMIDKLSNGKVDVHTAEGPMQFESLETFARELELSNG